MSASALLLLLAGIAGASEERVASPAEPIRVGVLAYEDFDDEFALWNDVLADFTRRNDPPLEFELAVGGYGDVLHWMRRGSIDVAVLTAGVFAEIQSQPQTDTAKFNKAEFDYLASMGLAPAKSPWASEQRSAPGFTYDYRSVCVVAADSKLATIADLREAAAADRVRFLFVHPLSVSGRIAPQHALAAADIRPLPSQIEFSYSHSESMRQAAMSSAERETVAFVWDDAPRNAPGLERSLKRVPFPELEALAIPHDVVAIRRGVDVAESLRKALVFLERESPLGNRVAFRYFDDWEGRYGRIVDWRRDVGLEASLDSAQAVSLDDIGSILLHGERASPAPVRLAVVLSGGGAKCSYQIGAVSALEEKLAEINRVNPGVDLDIDLVVGTSGGAINSVPIALGISRSPQGRADLGGVWASLDQRDLVRPAPIVRWNIGVWFALAETTLAFLILRMVVKRPRRRAWLFAGAIAMLGVVQLLLSLAPWSPWRLLGRSHAWHHAWLWGSFGWRTCAWCLLLLSAAVVAVQIARQRRDRDFVAPRKWTGALLSAGLFGLPLLQLLSLLFFQETLSQGDGIEHALAVEFPALVERQVASRNASAPHSDPTPPADDSATLRALSESLVSAKHLERDLVITGNCLRQTANTLPSDLYFFYDAGGDGPPPFAERGVNLADHPRILMDVVMGSGSIFPMFPARTICDFPTTGESIELVDGGFAHNSPIEAAVLWGATHVVLIEATPEKRPQRGNFVQNAAAAFTHLHKQTQNVDRRSRQQVVVFSLQPQAPHLCTLDFSSNLLEASIERGYRDARSRSSEGGRFRKEFGEPIFLRVGFSP